MCLFCRTQRKIFWRKFVTRLFWGTIDLHSREKNTMEINGAPELLCFPHSSEYLPLCSAEQRHSYRFGTTWGWVNDDRIFIFGWTVPLIHILIYIWFTSENCEEKSLLLTAFIWPKIHYNSTTVKYYYNLLIVLISNLLITVFYVNICSNVIYFCDAQLYFQHHYSSLQCHMIFRNHNNMLICCSIIIYYYWWLIVVLIIFNVE